jgi:uncharacterized protein YbjT (DUF2867 family)
MKNILVIGASGFVGSYLCRQLVAADYRVRCIARTPGKVQQLADLGCEIVQSLFFKFNKSESACDQLFFVSHTAANNRIMLMADLVLMLLMTERYLILLLSSILSSRF